jgi:predicted RecA/RadA family phage recombinase
MQNFIESGENIEFTAAANVTSGHPVAVGAINGVSKGTVLSGGVGVLMTSGVFSFPKQATVAITVGAKVYWDNTNKYINITASGNQYIGCATKAALAADTTVTVKLVSTNS